MSKTNHVQDEINKSLPPVHKELYDIFHYLRCGNRLQSSNDNPVEQDYREFRLISYRELPILVREFPLHHLVLPVTVIILLFKVSYKIKAESLSQDLRLFLDLNCQFAFLLLNISFADIEFLLFAFEGCSYPFRFPLGFLSGFHCLFALLEIRFDLSLIFQLCVQLYNLVAFLLKLFP